MAGSLSKAKTTTRQSIASFTILISQWCLGRKAMSDQEGNDLELDQERAEIDARRQGWRPLEEFKGPEKAWVDAETFLARGTEIRSFTKAENEKLRRELAEAK